MRIGQVIQLWKDISCSETPCVYMFCIVHTVQSRIEGNEDRKSVLCQFFLMGRGPTCFEYRDVESLFFTLTIDAGRNIHKSDSHVSIHYDNYHIIYHISFTGKYYVSSIVMVIVFFKLVLSINIPLVDNFNAIYIRWFMNRLDPFVTSIHENTDSSTKEEVKDSN